MHNQAWSSNSIPCKSGCKLGIILFITQSYLCSKNYLYVFIISQQLDYLLKKCFRKKNHQNLSHKFQSYFQQCLSSRWHLPKRSSGMKVLTHSYLEIYLTNVIWTCHSSYIYFGINNKFAKYLKESYRKRSDEQSSFKYFLNIAFVKEISSKLCGVTGMSRLTRDGDATAHTQRPTNSCMIDICCGASIESV